MSAHPILSQRLTAEKALIFRITHIRNVPWILRNGLHCRNSSDQDPDFIQIGNAELIEKRAKRTIPISPGGTLSDYVSFYFTPSSIMMYSIVKGRQFSNSEIVILVSSLRGLAQRGVAAVFSDRHAYLRGTQFFSSLNDLDKIDWKTLQKRDFERDPDNPAKKGRYQAEALIHRRLPPECLKGMVCHGKNEKRMLEAWKAEGGDDLENLRIVTRPGWYFR